MAEHNTIGRIGEDLATQWLIKEGFSLIERNFNKNWGEIDIVARPPADQTGGTDDTIHFIEVKTVSYETKEQLEWAVSHETWRPEENVHKNKQDRLKRAIQSWVIENKYMGEIRIDILTVRLVLPVKYAQVKLLGNVIFENR